MRTTLSTGTEASVVTRDDATTGLVIAPDIGGLRPLFDDMVERLAAEWAMSVCAVEPFPGQDLGADLEARFDAVAALDDDAHLADLEAGADALGLDRAVLIGFCMGGMYVNKATRSDRFDRLVSFYGMIRLTERWQGAPGHREPLDVIRTGHADRLLAVIGEQDPYTPPDDVAALEDAGVTTVRFPEAEHGFVHDADRPAHRAADAAAAWTAAKEWVSG